MNSVLGYNFLLERALGAILFCFVVGIFYFLINKCKNRKSFRIILCLFVVCITILAFIYIPAETSDVYRWNDLSNRWLGYDFKTFVKSYIFTSSTPASHLYIYLCTITRIPNFLSGCTCLIYYSILALFLYSYQKSKNVSFEIISTVFLLSMCSGAFISVISGIRTCLAFSTIFFCFYRESLLKKNIFFHLPLYLIACLVHNAGFPIVAIRFIAMILSSKLNRRMLFNLLILAIIFTFSFVFLQKYISAAFGKYDFYFEESGVYFSQKFYFTSILVFLLELFFVLLLS